jgi:hypothetical protein
MRNNGLQIRLWNLGKHLSNGVMNITLGLLFSSGMAVLYLSRRIVFKLLGNPVSPLAFFVFSQTASLIIDVPEFAACKLDDVDRKMVSDSMDVMG